MHCPVFDMKLTAPNPYISIFPHNFSPVCQWSDRNWTRRERFGVNILQFLATEELVEVAITCYKCVTYLNEWGTKSHFKSNTVQYMGMKSCYFSLIERGGNLFSLLPCSSWEREWSALVHANNGYNFYHTYTEYIAEIPCTFLDFDNSWIVIVNQQCSSQRYQDIPLGAWIRNRFHMLH